MPRRFSYLDDKAQPVGFGHEMCLKTVDEVKKATGRADLKGKTIVSTTGTTNFKILRNLNEERKIGMDLLGATDPYSIMLRRDDPSFKKLVDDTLAGLMKSGEFAKLYAKWFQSPIPLKGINLNGPMSQELIDK